VEFVRANSRARIRF